jgi:hypothetical protein
MKTISTLGDVHDELEIINSTLEDVRERIASVSTSVNAIGWIIVGLMVCSLLRHWLLSGELLSDGWLPLAG